MKLFFDKIQRVSSLRNFRFWVSVSEERDYQVFIYMNKAGIQTVYKLKLEEKNRNENFKKPISCTMCTWHAVDGTFTESATISDQRYSVRGQVKWKGDIH